VTHRDGPPIDDDILRLIESFRVPSTPSVRDPVARRVERRVADRRGLGFTARRREDAERNRQQRAFLLSYLRQLPDETLWGWIDGFWLGYATDAQLNALIQAVHESTQLAARSRGRTRSRVEEIIPGEHPLSTRYEWDLLTERFEDFGRARQRHHARTNRKRDGAPRSLASRKACLASPFGQRVDRAGLFNEFFDAIPRLIPAEMAARLLHHERRGQLTDLESYARAEAAQAPSAERKEMATIAARARARLRQFPTWKALYRKLERGVRMQR